MESWKLFAAAPPILVWIFLFLYVRRIESRLREAETMKQASLESGDN